MCVCERHPSRSRPQMWSVLCCINKLKLPSVHNFSHFYHLYDNPPAGIVLLPSVQFELFFPKPIKIFVLHLLHPVFLPEKKKRNWILILILSPTARTRKFEQRWNTLQTRCGPSEIAEWKKNQMHPLVNGGKDELYSNMFWLMPSLCLSSGASNSKLEPLQQFMFVFHLFFWVWISDKLFVQEAVNASPFSETNDGVSHHCMDSKIIKKQ